MSDIADTPFHIGMELKTYIFHRKDGWYPIELYNDKAALDSIAVNPGTLKVERMFNDGSSKLIWATN